MRTTGNGVRERVCILRLRGGDEMTIVDLFFKGCSTNIMV